jgi:hypothetical protein
MSRLAQEKLASGQITSIDTSYNSSLWNLGDLIKQRKDLNPPFLGPIAPAIGRPVEVMSGATPAIYPWAMQWSPTMDWVFFADGANATATQRRIQMWEFDRTNSAFNPKGHCVIQFPGIGAYTIQGFRMTYDPYYSGQVTVVAGGIVNGFQSTVNSSTAWKTRNIAAGSRIGFGSTNPNNITNWYRIGHIISDTSIFLNPANGTPGIISTSTNYVIEELRAIMETSNTTVGYSGLYVAKGLSYFDFPTNSSTLCPSCNTTVDSSRMCYWLADGTGPVLNARDISTCGVALEPMTDISTHFAYSVGLGAATGGTSIRIHKYNLRAPLVIQPGLGRSNSAVTEVSTGLISVTATVSRVNNSRFGILRHGPLQDASAIYFVSTTKIYGIKTSDIFNGATTGINVMSEVPPGGANMFAATSALNTIEHSSTLDRLIVMTTGATGARSYVTNFNTINGPMDHVFTADDKQLDQTTSDPIGTNATPHVTTLSLAQTCWVEGGLAYFAGTGTSATTNFLHVAPVGVEWTYSSSTNTQGRLISPKFSTPNCNRYIRVYTVRDNMLGSDVLGKRTDAMRISYRTAGIDDNTGAWSLLAEPNDLSGISAATAIQFLIEFKGITDFCVPARLMVLGLVYDDNTTDTHYQPSVKQSDYTNKYFAWRHALTFDASVPNLKIILTDAETTSTLLTDYTDVSTQGVWLKSTNAGASWGQFNNVDKTNEDTYIRYIPTSLADNIKVKATLLLK